MAVIPTGPQDSRAPQVIGAAEERLRRREEFLAQQEMQQERLQMQQTEAVMRQQQAAIARQNMQQKLAFDRAAKNAELMAKYGTSVEYRPDKGGGPGTYEPVAGKGPSQEDIAASRRGGLIQSLWPELMQRDPEKARRLAQSGLKDNQLVNAITKERDAERQRDAAGQYMLQKYPEINKHSLVLRLEAGDDLQSIEKDHLREIDEKQKESAWEVVSNRLGGQEERNARLVLGLRPDTPEDEIMQRAALERVKGYFREPEDMKMARLEYRQLVYQKRQMEASMMATPDEIAAVDAKIQAAKKFVKEQEKIHNATIAGMEGKLPLLMSFLKSGDAGFVAGPDTMGSLPDNVVSAMQQTEQSDALMRSFQAGVAGGAGLRVERDESGMETLVEGEPQEVVTPEGKGRRGRQQQYVGLAGQPRQMIGGQERPPAVQQEGREPRAESGLVAPGDVGIGAGVPSGPPEERDAEPVDFEQANAMAQRILSGAQTREHREELFKIVSARAAEGDKMSIAIRDVLIKESEAAGERYWRASEPRNIAKTAQNIVTGHPDLQQEAIEQLSEQERAGSSGAAETLDQLAAQGFVPHIKTRQRSLVGRDIGKVAYDPNDVVEMIKGGTWETHPSDLKHVLKHYYDPKWRRFFEVVERKAPGIMGSDVVEEMLAEVREEAGKR